jgi:hypothetical protein
MKTFLVLSEEGSNDLSPPRLKISCIKIVITVIKNYLHSGKVLINEKEPPLELHNYWSNACDKLEGGMQSSKAETWQRKT